MLQSESLIEHILHYTRQGSTHIQNFTPPVPLFGTYLSANQVKEWAGDVPSGRLLWWFYWKFVQDQWQKKITQVPSKHFMVLQEAPIAAFGHSWDSDLITNEYPWLFHNNVSGFHDNFYNFFVTFHLSVLKQNDHSPQCKIKVAIGIVSHKMASNSPDRHRPTHWN